MASSSQLVPLCVACLSSKCELNSILHSPFYDYFQQVIPVGLNFAFLKICWQCKAMVKKIFKFNKQAEESFKTLYTFLQKNNDFSEISKPERLQIKHLESFSVSRDINIKEICIPISHDSAKNCDSSDSDEPLIVLKTEIGDSPKEITRQQDGKEKKCKKKSTLTRFPIRSLLNKGHKRAKSNGFGGSQDESRKRKSIILDSSKIRTILLTQDELSAERSLELKNESFLKLPYKCHTCIQGFDHEQTLNDHIERKHNLTLGKYQCETCQSVLSSQASYNTHSRRHLLRFECVPCGKRTVDKGAILKHYSKEHETIDTRYTCNLCGVISTSQRAHRYHREKHKERPQCQECGKTFINNNSLRCHILNQHETSNAKPHECKECGKKYRGKSGLLMHAWTHTSDRPYCVPCGQHFRTPHNYRHHIRTHKNHRSELDLKFSCKACDKKFTTQRQVAEHHAWVHLQSREHECAHCHKIFKHKVGLERHKKYVHEKIRPPRDKMCHYCGRGFTTSAILRSHIRTHTGARPLKCNACGATFAHSAALYTHNKLLHGGADRNRK